MSATFVRAALVLVVLSIASPARAQGKKYALLVGVTEYDSSTFTTLKYTENDAAKLAGVLKDAGYDEVIVLTTSKGKTDKKAAPTAENIRAALAKLSGKVKRDDLLLVGLAGHGVLWSVLDEKTKKERDESFFCPADARLRSGKSIAELSKTMIPLGELFRTLDESGAGVRLMLVDACRNEVKGEARSIDFDHLPRTKKGTAVLFSCKAGERAFESEKLKHGVFFHHVIEGLKGKAEDTKGRVSWSRLVEHVVEKVTEEVPTLIGGGAKQTPHKIENIEGVSPLLLPLVKARNTDGDAETLYDLANKYEFGRGVTKDEKKAFELYTKAVDKGHTKAMASLGWMYMNGQGVAKDEKKAVEWYTKAAEKGHTTAMDSLGSFYMNGQGVAKDEKKAVEWFAKAADKDHAGAMTNLGGMYMLGLGVTKDEKKALELYKKAADRGQQYAMFNLGVMYEDGQGVAKDVPEALKWYKKAAALGFDEAKKAVERLESKK